jgi:hypothetical protein
MSPFTRCEAGHDLTAADAYIHDAQNRRLCRACTLASKARHRKTSRNYAPAGTWAEKRGESRG